MKQPRYYFIPSKKCKKHKVSFYDESGKRFAKFFETKGEAIMYITELRNQSSLPTELSFTIKERILFSQLKSVCEIKKIGIEKVIEIVNNYTNPNLSNGYEWSDAVKMYLAECERRKVRLSTLKGYINKISLFQRRENVKNVAEITLERAENYLATISSPSHSKRALRPFFAFCCEKKWIIENPFFNAKIKKELGETKLPSVLSIEATQYLFDNAPKDYLPELALMTFAGIRPMELLYNKNEPKDVLKVGDIDFENKTIRIRSSVAKTRTERSLIGLPNNLWQFLEPLKHRNKNENVAVSDFDRNYKIRKNLGAGAKDILRHSFASYGYHFLGIEHSVEILGHVRNFNTFAKNYKGLASKEDAIEYFSIIP